MSAAMKDYWKNHIGGKWVDGSGGGRIALLNPATGKPLAEAARATAADVDSAVAAARRCVASRALVDMRPMARGRMVAEIGRKLRERSEEIAPLISLDAGSASRRRGARSRARPPISNTMADSPPRSRAGTSRWATVMSTMSCPAPMASAPTSFRGTFRST